jgi:hypothetical protein
MRVVGPSVLVDVVGEIKGVVDVGSCIGGEEG